MLYLYAAGATGLASLTSAVLGADEERWSRLAGNLGRLLAIAVVSVPAGSVFWPHRRSAANTALGAFVKTTQLDWPGDSTSFSAARISGRRAAVALCADLAGDGFASGRPGRVRPVVADCQARTRQAVAWAGLFAFAAVPVAAAIVRHATIYDDPAPAVHRSADAALAGAGWSALLDTRARVACAALLIVGMAERSSSRRNHPNQIVYIVR